MKLYIKIMKLYIKNHEFIFTKLPIYIRKTQKKDLENSKEIFNNYDN